MKRENIEQGRMLGDENKLKGIKETGKGEREKKKRGR